MSSNDDPMGIGNLIFGCVLVLIGVLMLPFAGIGLIPMVIGGMLLTFGRPKSSR